MIEEQQNKDKDDRNTTQDLQLSFLENMIFLKIVEGELAVIEYEIEKCLLIK